MDIAEKRQLVKDSKSTLSISKQCKILNLSPSTFYYEKKNESDLNLELMRIMDEHYLEHPYKGARRMHVWLTMDESYQESK